MELGDSPWKSKWLCKSNREERPRSPQWNALCQVRSASLRLCLFHPASCDFVNFTPVPSAGATPVKCAPLWLRQFHGVKKLEVCGFGQCGILLRRWTKDCQRIRLCWMYTRGGGMTGWGLGWKSWSGRMWRMLWKEQCWHNKQCWNAGIKTNKCCHQWDSPSDVCNPELYPD